ncbi:T23J18.5 [Dunaliella salina]|uniref:T23J18.5 n=1 Tax=Dunaliella salina TaxID=3046 RepID=A0ABQ7GBD9_DUNSA|nr:T23J18.5 [Dunaliella salina]|eukprot:KAF5831929.1 T23J18.5 [Dunaliella salina]
MFVVMHLHLMMRLHAVIVVMHHHLIMRFHAMLVVKHLHLMPSGQAGPAFIKWGQWAATRPDLFPLDLCHALEQLQTKAPAHPAVYSRDAIEAAFGFKIEQLFSSFEDDPVASGSIAQIHRGQLSQAAAVSVGSKPGKTVAIKVRHPGVTAIMHRDFVLMERAAKMASAIPGVSELRLDESIRQFGGPLKEQLDLAVEAGNLMRFKCGLVMCCVAMDVSMCFSKCWSRFGGDCFLGNERQCERIACVCACGLSDLQGLQVQSVTFYDGHCADNFCMWSNMAFPSPMYPLMAPDTGMIAELSKPDQGHLIDFFRAMTKQDGERLGMAILDMSERHTCKVTLRSTVSTVVVTTLVLEGWSSKLNPELRILDHVRDMLVVDWNERMSRTVDKVMKGGALAVA